MDNNITQPTSEEIKTDLISDTTRFTIDAFKCGCWLAHNYINIKNLNVEIDVLLNDLNRLVWYIRGRQLYGLPIVQSDINRVHTIKKLIEQKQTQKSEAKKEIWITGIFAALTIGCMILDNVNKNNQKR